MCLTWALILVMAMLACLNIIITRLFAAELIGSKSGLSAENYLAITKTSRTTATRDLQDLVEMSALQRTGERKHTRYTLNILTVSGVT